MEKNLLIKNALIVGAGPDLEVKDGADIRITGKVIAEVGYDLPRRTDDTVIDASDHLVMPGMTAAHYHSHDHFNKARFDNLPLELWMLYIKPQLGGISWTPEEYYLRTMLGAIELVETGVTAIMDFVVLQPLIDEAGHRAVRQAYLDIGLPGVVTCDLGDRVYYETIPYLKELLPASLRARIDARPAPDAGSIVDYMRHLMASYNESDAGLVRFAPGPSGPQRCTDALLTEAASLAAEFDVPLVSHVLESKVQCRTASHLYGGSMVEHLRQVGFLGPRTSLIHGVWLDEREIELLADHDASLIHCPVSNLKLGSGVAPVRGLLEAGVNVALGPDNTSANDSQNMFDTMRCGALINKLSGSACERWVGGREMLQAATSGGARARLASNAGTIEAGRPADLVIIDTRGANYLPMGDPINHLVFCEHGESVRTVIINGRIVKQGGRLLTVDKAEIYRRVRELYPKIRESVRLSAEQAEGFYGPVKSAYTRLMAEPIDGGLRRRLD